MAKAIDLPIEPTNTDELGHIMPVKAIRMA